MVPVHTVYGTPIRGDDCEIREVGDFLLFYDFMGFFFLHFFIERGRGGKKGGRAGKRR